MRLVFAGKSITGIALTVPTHEQTFIDDMAKFDFPQSRSLKLQEVMGYDRHRLVQGDVCSSDLAIHTLRKLDERGLAELDSIDALIVVTQTPDYLMPPTSFVIHGELGLRRDTVCLDVVQGCAGFLVGLIQGFSLLEQPQIKKVALVNVDVMSRKVSHRDRNSYPLIGDACSAVFLGRGQSEVHANIFHDGTKRAALMIPAGGMKLPSSEETGMIQEVGDGNWRSKDNLVIDGSAVFNFVQQEIPDLVADLFEFAGISDEDVFAYAFHQPNKFMLEKLCEKLGVSKNKMPMDLVGRYGNSSGVTVPAVLATNLRQNLLEGGQRYCLAGFGVGLTWSSMTLSIGPLDFVETFQFGHE